MALHAKFFDGVHSRPHQVTLAVSATSLRLAPVDGAPPVIWTLADVVILDEWKQTHPARLSYRQTPDARLLIENSEDWARLRPHLAQARNVTPILSASWGTLGMYALLCVMIIALAMHYIPKSAGHLAVFVPDSAARNIGREVITSYFNHPVCVGEEGEAAFRKLYRSIEGGLEKPLPPTLAMVVKNKEGNAFAVPGDYVVVFAGLADKTDGVDEYAGVLAHEMGHVHYSHPLRAMMRYMGFSFTMRMMVGDSRFLDAAGMLNALRFSREDEATADDFAVATLRRAGMDAARFADFFERHAKSEKMLMDAIRSVEKRKKPENGTSEDKKDKAGERAVSRMMAYLSTHPDNMARVAAIRAAAGEKPKDYKPALSAKEWAALKKICDKTVPLKEWLDTQDE